MRSGQSTGCPKLCATNGHPSVEEIFWYWFGLSPLLTDLLRKKRKFNWSEKAKANFEKLKAFLCSASLIHNKLLTLIYINWCYSCIKDNFTHLGNTLSAVEICKYMKNGPSLFFMYKETSNFQLALWGTEAKTFSMIGTVGDLQHRFLFINCFPWRFKKNCICSLKEKLERIGDW